ncbi:MAG: DNA replication/repair protein RecF, partial [Microbacteriaceae bacterium]|nr:DNA replication/repair protein RecF [Microbacteriaceae bacterium]
LFVGRNGQGKTNLIEALGYLSTLGSHRVTADHAMIRQNANSAVIRAQIKYDGREVLAEVQLNRTGVNRAQINRSAIKIRELPRYFASVLFAPEDLALIRGDPSGRRRFLDQLLILRTPRFAGVMFDFDRVIRQRNSLLKSARSARLGSENLSTLEIWDERLVELGSEIMLARSGLVAELASEVSRAYLLVAGDDHHPRMTIQSSLIEEATQGDGSSALSTLEQIAERFRTALMRVRRSEVERAVTLVGPHRDDLVLELNSMPARGYASHGESWSFALSLKLAAAEILRRESSTGDPVLILDDVFAELDRQRRTRLAHAIEGFEQVLITAAVLEDVPVELTAHTVHVRSGRIEEQHVS